MGAAGCPARVAVTLALLVSPLAVCLLALALRQDEWVALSAQPPHAPHEVACRVGLESASLSTRPVAAAAARLPALRVPPVPLRHLVGGPPAVCRFRQQMVLGGAAARGGGRASEVPGVEAVFLGPLGDGEQRDADWDVVEFQPLLDGAAGVWLCALRAAGLAASGVAAEVLGLLRLTCQCCCGPPRGGSGAAVVRLAGLLHVGAGTAAGVGMAWYAAAYRERLKVFVSELLFALTDGDVAVWPADMAVRPGLGLVLLACASGALLLCGLVLLGCELGSLCPPGEERAADVAAAPPQGRPLRAVAVTSWALGSSPEPAGPAGAEFTSEQRDFLDSSLSAARDDLKRHHGRSLLLAFLLMAAFVLMLGAMGYVLGRRAVEQGLQNALRGPDLSVKQTRRALGKVRDAPFRSLGDARRALHGATRASAVATAGQARRAARAAVSGVAVALRNSSDAARAQDWQGLRRAARAVPRSSAAAAGAALREGRRAAASARRAWRLRRFRRLQQDADDAEEEDEDDDEEPEQRRRWLPPWRGRQAASRKSR